MDKQTIQQYFESVTALSPESSYESVSAVVKELESKGVNIEQQNYSFPKDEASWLSLSFDERRTVLGTVATTLRGLLSVPEKEKKETSPSFEQERVTVLKKLTEDQEKAKGKAETNVHSFSHDLVQNFGERLKVANAQELERLSQEEKQQIETHLKETETRFEKRVREGGRAFENPTYALRTLEQEYLRNPPERVSLPRPFTTAVPEEAAVVAIFSPVVKEHFQEYYQAQQETLLLEKTKEVVKDTTKDLTQAVAATRIVTWAKPALLGQPVPELKKEVQALLDVPFQFETIQKDIEKAVTQDQEPSSLLRELYAKQPGVTHEAVQEMAALPAEQQLTLIRESLGDNFVSFLTFAQRQLQADPTIRNASDGTGVLLGLSKFSGDIVGSITSTPLAREDEGMLQNPFYQLMVQHNLQSKLKNAEGKNFLFNELISKAKPAASLGFKPPKDDFEFLLMLSTLGDTSMKNAKTGEIIGERLNKEQILKFLEEHGSEFSATYETLSMSKTVAVLSVLHRGAGVLSTFHMLATDPKSAVGTLAATAAVEAAAAYLLKKGVSQVVLGTLSGGSTAVLSVASSMLQRIGSIFTHPERLLDEGPDWVALGILAVILFPLVIGLFFINFGSVKSVERRDMAPAYVGGFGVGYPEYNGELPPEAAVVGCPVAPGSGTLTQCPDSNFTHYNTDAFDIGLSIGSPVYAVHDGFVFQFTDGMPNRSVSITLGDYAACGSYGNNVWLVGNKGGKPYYTIYGHLTKVTDEVKSAKANHTLIHAGQLIGLSGNSGCSEGPHLHIEYRSTAAHATSEKVLSLPAGCVAGSCN